MSDSAGAPGGAPAPDAVRGPADGQPERQFGWWDMFVPPEGDPRSDGGFTGERDTLAGYLRDQRLTLELKCADLDANAMARRSVEPSNLSLLGLVRHMTNVERSWFRRVLAGQEASAYYRAADGTNLDFDGAEPDRQAVAAAWDAWRQEVAFAERFAADAPDLGISGTYQHGPFRGSITLREVLVHMIEEYARHNGHADFLRERIDGRVGQ
jgi:uncharacterized damage-inducible protein DinB